MPVTEAVGSALFQVEHGWQFLASSHQDGPLDLATHASWFVHITAGLAVFDLATARSGSRRPAAAI